MARRLKAKFGTWKALRERSAKTDVGYFYTPDGPTRSYEGVTPIMAAATRWSQDGGWDGRGKRCESYPSLHGGKVLTGAFVPNSIMVGSEKVAEFWEDRGRIKISTPPDGPLSDREIDEIVSHYGGTIVAIYQKWTAHA